MNDAHTPRRDAAAGSGGNRRSEDPYTPYPEPHPNDYGPGQYPQPPNPYQPTEPDPYTGQYPNGYPTPQPSPGPGHGGQSAGQGDGWSATQSQFQGQVQYPGQRGTADPSAYRHPSDTGAQPRVPRQPQGYRGDQPPHDGYGPGQYPPSSYDSGQYGGEAPGSGHYHTGQYASGQYDSGRYAAGQYDTGQQPVHQYPPGPQDTGGYGPGRFHEPERQPSRPPAHPSGQYQVGPLQGHRADGRYATDPGDTGQLPFDPRGHHPYPRQGEPQPSPDHYQGAQQPHPRQAPSAAQQGQTPSANPYDELGALVTEPGGEAGPPRASTAEQGRPLAGNYQTEQFAFVDDEEEDEEVIDWLKFAETRSERRDERKRRGRHRVLALVVVVVLVLAGGGAYLWKAGKLPFLGSGSGTSAAAAQKRDVIVVHLRELDSANSSTALLVSNESTGKGTTMLLPNSLAISTDSTESSTLGKSVESAGAGPTRDGLSTLLGADIKGTWRLDTPFLELLVESLGGITVNTDSEVKGTGKEASKTLVRKGSKQSLNGPAAVAYATHRAGGETADRQLARFGQVLEAVLRKLPGSAASAVKTVQSLGAVADPSLPDEELGASLADLAEQAKTGAYRTVSLSVQDDGTLDDKTASGLVKDVLGGTVKNADPGATPTVSVRNATGRTDSSAKAQVALVNSGYTFVSGGTAPEVSLQSTVRYTDAASAQAAREVAQTLGLPKGAVKKGSSDAGNARISVVLGQDYEG